MDDSLQQAAAVTIIVLAVAAELWRRHRKKKSGKTGCDGCEAGKPERNSSEAPLKFYKRK
jgi:hypothetical protein